MSHPRQQIITITNASLLRHMKEKQFWYCYNFTCVSRSTSLMHSAILASIMAGSIPLRWANSSKCSVTVKCSKRTSCCGHIPAMTALTHNIISNVDQIWWSYGAGWYIIGWKTFGKWWRLGPNPSCCAHSHGHRHRTHCGRISTLIPGDIRHINYQSNTCNRFPGWYRNEIDRDIPWLGKVVPWWSCRDWFFQRLKP